LVLVIKGNKLTSLPCIEAFPNITEYDASDNMVTSVPIIPSWINSVLFNGNPLTDISAIYNAPQLIQMRFYGCGITAELPSNFNSWPNLQYLAWGKNNFYGYLNETAFNGNPKLLEVDLSYNNLV
jgi:Leucine-rich repeat (LRR) protein